MSDETDAAREPWSSLLWNMPLERLADYIVARPSGFTESHVATEIMRARVTLAVAEATRDAAKAADAAARGADEAARQARSTARATWFLAIVTAVMAGATIAIALLAS